MLDKIIIVIKIKYHYLQLLHVPESTYLFDEHCMHWAVVSQVKQLTSHAKMHVTAVETQVAQTVLSQAVYL